MTAGAYVGSRFCLPATTFIGIGRDRDLGQCFGWPIAIRAGDLLELQMIWWGLKGLG